MMIWITSVSKTIIGKRMKKQSKKPVKKKRESEPAKPKKTQENASYAQQWVVYPWTRGGINE